MSHTDPGQPDLAALRAAAGDAESAEAEAGSIGACGYPLTDADPLARDLARSLTEAGSTMNAALRCILTAFGYLVAWFGCGGACPITVRRRRGAGAGR